jgi:hypothetical protein
VKKISAVAKRGNEIFKQRSQRLVQKHKNSYKEEKKNRLDAHRPSHGRSLAATAEVQMDLDSYPSASRFRASASKRTCLHSSTNSPPNDL